MKIRFLVLIYFVQTLFISRLNAQFQIINIGDNADKVNTMVRMQVDGYYQSQGDHSTREDYKVVMDNGRISEIIMQVENIPDQGLQRAISFRFRYVMKSGILFKVMKEYFDVSISELKQQFSNSYKGNRIGEYIFNQDFTVVTRCYLGANHLATEESKAVILSDFPPSMQIDIKKYKASISNEKNGNTNQKVTPNQPENKNILEDGNWKFCDEGELWYYRVKLRGDMIMLNRFPGEKNTSSKGNGMPAETILGTYSEGRILTHDPPEYKTDRFKYENGMLYEVSDEGEYNEYKICN